MTWLAAIILLSGCATIAPVRTASLTHGLSQDQVIVILGDPAQKMLAGKTARENFPVEVWEYAQPGKGWFGKKKELVLIFVDHELYQWETDNPDAVLEALIALGIFNIDGNSLNREQYQNMMRKNAEDAAATQRTMEIIKTYQSYMNTHMNMQNYQLFRTLQHQQNFNPPPPARPVHQPPVLPQRRP